MPVHLIPNSQPLLGRRVDVDYGSFRGRGCVEAVETSFVLVRFDGDRDAAWLPRSPFEFLSTPYVLEVSE